VGIFDALSRKPTVQGESVEATQWRTLGSRSLQAIDLFVVRPQSDLSKRFLKTLSQLRSRFESEVITIEQFETTSKSLEAVSSEFANAQREEIEGLIVELGSAVSETLSMFESSIDAAGKPIGEMEAVRRNLVDAQKTPSLEEVRKHLSQGVAGLQKLVEEQTARERSLRAEFMAHSKKLSAHLEKAHEEGRTDPLTGLANRRAYEEYAQSAFEKAAREGETRCIAMLDLDGFKPLNDTYGHAAGDAALVTFSGRLRKAVGDKAFVGRLGGDEFVVVSDASPTMLEGMFVKLANSCGDHPCFHEDRRMTIRFSYGIAEFDGKVPEHEVRKKADGALYAFKQSRKATRAA
jgi:diguanylate cyclase (GGDEF)-like protein